MLTTGLIVLALACLALFAAALSFVRWGSRWGASPEECATAMTGDAYLNGGPQTRVAMTRAISIQASPEQVWPWLAQIGRGAGWYSIDALDNGHKRSAEHLVSWIPAPALGDSTAIGYLRHLDSGRELVWWVPGLPYLGTTVRLVVDMLIQPDRDGARLCIRMSGDALGTFAVPALWFFRFIDSIMAIRQLREIKRRAEAFGTRRSDPARPETGRVDQYQLYEVLYASGKTAGVQGTEQSARWRRAAIEDGVLGED